MKNKIPLYITLVLLPVAVILRALQYFTIIDGEGFFEIATLGDAVIRAAVPVVFGLVAAVAFVICLCDKNTAQDVGGKSVGIAYIALGLVLATESGVRASNLDYVSIFAILAAIYLCLDGIFILTNHSRGKKTALFSVIVPLYYCFCGIHLFLTLFSKANASYVRLDMLAVCAAAIMFITLSVSAVSDNVKRGRIKAAAMISVLFSLTPVFSQVADLVQDVDITAVISALRNLVTGLVSLSVLISVCDKTDGAEE